MLTHYERRMFRIRFEKNHISKSKTRTFLIYFFSFTTKQKEPKTKFRLVLIFRRGKTMGEKAFDIIKMMNPFFLRFGSIVIKQWMATVYWEIQYFSLFRRVCFLWRYSVYLFLCFFWRYSSSVFVRFAGFGFISPWKCFQSIWNVHLTVSFSHFIEKDVNGPIEIHTNIRKIDREQFRHIKFEYVFLWTLFMSTALRLSLFSL